MPPVFIIKGKVHPFLERYGFVHSRYDKAELVNNGFLVHVQYTSAFSLVVTRRGNKFGGKMVVIIVYHFTDKGELLC